MTADPRPALMAAFPDEHALCAAARALAGRPGMDAFTPYPVEGLAETLGMRRTRLPLAMLAGGMAGAVFVYALILYSVTIAYPINVGGRGLNAWPAYLMLAFEGGILGAALAGGFGLFRANGLPQLHDPVFATPGFTFARGGGFWLLVPLGGDTADALRARLTDLGGERVEEVPQ
ncbi:DUF3341 domain-containing protein [Psychromarinibacter sp. C21-152]|uniref:DUF3341 domain-containing protein n=1 Tax=Psychromarinibacter sediminicola TaxID=3033385 RepID=A0AAE3NXH8_9RHOB|nr:DUF3341 domain-containing protein [Psychromarinibacter sediminicola]MDF0602760.1 DUF3341 domain-containing protein [Psychromarinibacter sediminicola]